jgi:hypothetical protein
MLHLASQGCVVGRGGGCFLSSFVVFVVTTFSVVIFVMLCCIRRTFGPLLLNEKIREVVFEKKTKQVIKTTSI